MDAWLVNGIARGRATRPTKAISRWRPEDGSTSWEACGAGITWFMLMWTVPTGTKEDVSGEALCPQIELGRNRVPHITAVPDSKLLYFFKQSGEWRGQVMAETNLPAPLHRLAVEASGQPHVAFGARGSNRLLVKYAGRHGAIRSNGDGACWSALAIGLLQPTELRANTLIQGRRDHPSRDQGPRGIVNPRSFFSRVHPSWALPGIGIGLLSLAQ